MLIFQKVDWPKRLYLLDISRGIASLSVVIWHWQIFMFSGTSFPKNLDRSILPYYGILKIFYEQGAHGVSYFFLLSGFVFFWLYSEKIKNGKVSTKKFWIARFSRLYPLHIVTLLIVLALSNLFLEGGGISDFIEFLSNDLYHFILNLFLVNYWGFQSGFSFNAPVWSVSVEFFLYLLFFILAKRGLLNLISCLLISFLSFIIFKSELFSKPLLLGSLSFFFGGAIFYGLKIFIKYSFFRLLVYLTTIVSWILVFVDIYFFSFNEILDSFGILGRIVGDAFMEYLLFPSTLCTLLLLELKSIRKKLTMSFFKRISWIGDITYSTYLLHFPLQILFGLLVYYNILKLDFYTKEVYFLLFFAILIPVSLITFKKFERPVQNKIRKIIK